MKTTDELLSEIDGALASTEFAPLINGQVADPGTENIERAGLLSAQALRDSFEECAKRTEDTIQAVKDRAAEIIEHLQEVAAAARRCGDVVGKQIEDFASKAKLVATHTSQTKMMIEQEPMQ